MIIATAGHVDHGKTSLVRALTGVDTDRLDEEKRRGLTIDLGYAFADLGGGEPTAFVDVPGHERFARNLLAGVHDVDLALLVVAADDGPMPQTREHLSVLHWLGARELCVVLTKIDRVDDARQAAATAEVRTLLGPTRFAEAAVMPVSTHTGAGMDALRDHLVARRAACAERPTGDHFRLAIDRAFVLPGAGLVVTGQVLSGEVRPGDELVISPDGDRVRVRTVHAQQVESARARTGQRCALNLAGLRASRPPPGRGQWVLAEALHAPTARFDARLLRADELAPWPGPRTTLQIHLGTAMVNARVVPLGEPDAGWVQCQLDAPVSALHGDRFVVRDPAGQRAIGGGRVIDPFAAARGREHPARLAELAALDTPAPVPRLARWLAATPLGVERTQLERAWNLAPAAADALVRGANADTRAIDGEAWVIPTDTWSSLRVAALRTLREHHQAHPQRIGPIETQWQTAIVDAWQTARPETPRDPRQRPRAMRLALAVLRECVAQGEVVRQGASHRLPEHQPVLDEADRALLAQVRAVLETAGLRPPIVGDLAQTVQRSRAELLEFLRRMAADGYVVAVAPNRFFLPATVDELAEVARRLAHASPDGGFDAAAYRDASGIGRNLTIEVLEHLDRIGITRFARQRRHLR